MASRKLTRSGALKHLEELGFTPAKAAQVSDSFDWDQPVYLERLEVGERLRQYMRRPWGGSVEGCAFDSARNLGDFFSLPSAAPADLAIGSGLSGRDPVDFIVQRPIEVLGGTARSMVPDFLADSVGGPGGATQFVLARADKFALFRA